MVRRATPSRPILFTIGLVTLMSASSAAAQVAGPPYYLKGSDTLFDIMTQAISNAVASGVACGTTCAAPKLPPNTLIYDGTGSGNAETEMKYGANTGVLGIQSIGPMSRNFRPAVVGQFPSWQPRVQNVVALDAAVIVTKAAAASFKNFSLPLLAADPTKANPNTAGQAITFGTTGSGYDQMLEVILSGIDGSGSVAACADQRRVQAISDFSASNGGAIIRHFYRRDDNSGTTDTFKDKIAVGRFCNGAAVGVLGTNKTQPNLNNQDLDPIRRPCDVAAAGRVQVTCTDLTTGLACNSATAPCTQGLVTALSENDPGSSDITVTIANRVKADPSGAVVGYAGREAIRLPAGGTSGPLINTNPPSDALVRLDAYMLARRLFLQRGPAIPALDVSVNFPSAGVRASTSPYACATPPCNERILDNGGTNTGFGCPDGNANKCTGGGISQRDFEDILFNYMTDPSGSASQDGAQGRCNTDPVARQFGFLSCLDDCTVTPSGNNLCSKTPFANPASPPSACVPTSGAWAYGATTTTVKASGTAAPSAPVCCANNAAATLPATGTCSIAGTTCSAGTACPGTETCNYTASCPAANSGRVLNSACSAVGQAECATGTTCTDLGGGLLACQ